MFFRFVVWAVCAEWPRRGEFSPPQAAGPDDWDFGWNFGSVRTVGISAQAFGLGFWLDRVLGHI
jgi:hypothetical protein